MFCDSRVLFFNIARWRACDSAFLRFSTTCVLVGREGGIQQLRWWFVLRQEGNVYRRPFDPVRPSVRRAMFIDPLQEAFSPYVRRTMFIDRRGDPVPPP